MKTFIYLSALMFWGAVFVFASSLKDYLNSWAYAFCTLIAVIAFVLLIGVWVSYFTRGKTWK